ncbi:hypothetical protein V2J56_03970 [Georgenia sp. MJ206]|uniref:hypothetical protein n=1 Tax=Georgenia wangjunii TaxID=3117730 RepID=UPI002F26C40C
MIPVDDAAASEALRAANANITDVAVYDDTNDPNELIGRPGQYISAARITDARAEGGDGIDAGAVIEVFATPEDAQARSDYIQETLADLGPGVRNGVAPPEGHAPAAGERHRRPVSERGVRRRLDRLVPQRLTSADRPWRVLRPARPPPCRLD